MLKQVRHPELSLGSEILSTEPPTAAQGHNSRTTIKALRVQVGEDSGIPLEELLGSTNDLAQTP